MDAHTIDFGDVKNVQANLRTIRMMNLAVMDPWDMKVNVETMRVRFSILKSCSNNSYDIYHNLQCACLDGISSYLRCGTHVRDHSSGITIWCATRIDALFVQSNLGPGYQNRWAFKRSKQIHLMRHHCRFSKNKPTLYLTRKLMTALPDASFSTIWDTVRISTLR